MATSRAESQVRDENQSPPFVLLYEAGLGAPPHLGESLHSWLQQFWLILLLQQPGIWSLHPQHQHGHAAVHRIYP